MNIPKVSIITPTFNRPDFLNLVLECVIAQTYPNIEWLILDDGPSPNLDFKNKDLSNSEFTDFELKILEFETIELNNDEFNILV